MKNIFFIVLLLGLLLDATGQVNFDAKDRETMAKNRVKTQIESTYDFVNGKPGTKGYKSESRSYDRSGNVVLSCTFKANGDTLSKNVYKYDAQGNRISYFRYYKRDLTYSLVTRYDAKGNKLSETGINGDPRFGGTPFNNTFTYDGNGHLSEIRYTENKVLQERRVFKYSSNTLEMTILNPTGAITGKETTVLDGKQNVIENAKYIQDNIAIKSSYEYDQSGKKIEETKVKNGNLDNRTKYVYDSRGNITQIGEESNNKTFIAYQYKYDAQNNVIEEKWAKEGATEFSKKSHKYDMKGLLSETEYYNASSKFSSLSKFTYAFY
jgi:YD repeat-containing protein